MFTFHLSLGVSNRSLGWRIVRRDGRHTSGESTKGVQTITKNRYETTSPGLPYSSGLSQKVPCLGPKGRKIGTSKSFNGLTRHGVKGETICLYYYHEWSVLPTLLNRCIRPGLLRVSAKMFAKFESEVSFLRYS